MSNLTSGPCTRWAEVDDLIGECKTNISDVDLMEQWLDVASSLLFQLSGRQFPGECEMVVRPCSQWGNPHLGIPDWRIGGIDSLWFEGFCSCNRSDTCGCNSYPQIDLGSNTVSEVTEVKVDGVVVSPDLYRLDGYRYLVRLNDPDGTNPGWPCCQDLLLPSSEPDTFEVSYTRGKAPPAPLKMAAAVWACEFYKAGTGDSKCRLPQRVQSITRQGMSMVVLDPLSFLDQGKTGIPEVDYALSAYNPKNLRGRATVHSPDVPRRSRKLGT